MKPLRALALVIAAAALLVLPERVDLGAQQTPAGTGRQRRAHPAGEGQHLDALGRR